jgi:hypothetical protein
MKSLHSARVLLFASILALSTAEAADLTPEQIASIKAKIEGIKANLDGHLSSRNTSAGSAFAAAAADPRAAAELYLNCSKVVNFDREGRPESDFRAWKEEQTERLRDPKFLASLQMQLQYLTLSCQAAESEKIDAVFTPLMSFVDSLSRLEETPAGGVTESVAGSVFAKTYYLDKLLSNSENWEPVPINISGIYEKTILPYLRDHQPDALLNAWDKRIEQQTRIVATVESLRDEDLRGMTKDEERRARGNQGREGGVMRQLSKEEFTARTLPKLQWDRLKDQFKYVDQLEGAKAMLAFVEAHLVHELGEEFYAEFIEVIDQAQGVGSARMPTPAQ